jgi:hypothetical protein
MAGDRKLPGGGVDVVVEWFDLGAGGGLPLGPASETEIPLLQQLLLYAVVVAGVLLSEAVAMARHGRSPSLDLSWAWVLTASLIALVVFPAVWRQIGVMAETSLLVQMGLAAQGGVFWGVLMAGVEKQARA